MLYFCDILTQLTDEGFSKIMVLRETDPKCLAEDRKIAAEKGLSTEKVRKMSALKSARELYEIITKTSEFPSLRDYAQKLWNELHNQYFS